MPVHCAWIALIWGTWNICLAVTLRSPAGRNEAVDCRPWWSRSSRTRQRYERQGILAEVEAIAAAERECLADTEVRERRRERDAQRRVVEDERFVADLAAAIRAQFPGCSAERADRIARHAGARSSGRIGRTSAGRVLEAEAVRLAVIAAVRHEDTRYEELLMSGTSRNEARELVREDVDQVLCDWLLAARS